MKISELISILNDVKDAYGDMHIWSADGLEDFPMPRTIELDLCKRIKRTDFGCSGGKASETKKVDIYIDYDEAKFVDRCIQERDE